MSVRWGFVLRRRDPRSHTVTIAHGHGLAATDAPAWLTSGLLAHTVRSGRGGRFGTEPTTVRRLPAFPARPPREPRPHSTAAHHLHASMPWSIHTTTPPPDIEREPRPRPRPHPHPQPQPQPQPRPHAHCPAERRSLARPRRMHDGDDEDDDGQRCTARQHPPPSVAPLRACAESTAPPRRSVLCILFLES